MQVIMKARYLVWQDAEKHFFRQQDYKAKLSKLKVLNERLRKEQAGIILENRRLAGENVSAKLQKGFGASCSVWLSSATCFLLTISTASSAISLKSVQYLRSTRRRRSTNSEKRDLFGKIIGKQLKCRRANRTHNSLLQIYLSFITFQTFPIMSTSRFAFAFARGNLMPARGRKLSI